MAGQERYKAFISYKQGKDSAFARKLQRELESYVIPRVSTITGEAPKRRPLRPVFLDETEAVPGPDLPERVRHALEQSEFLIVVCSPRSAPSQWVEREIVEFTKLGRGERILAVVIDGVPWADKNGALALQEALPRALRYRVTDDGTITGDPADPFWIDRRGTSTANRLVFLRIVAALLGLESLDDLIKRDRARQQRRSIYTAGAAFVGAMLLGGVLYFGYQSWQTEQRVQRNIDAAESFLMHNVSALSDPATTSIFGSEGLQLKMLQSITPEYQRLISESGENDPRVLIARSRAALALGRIAADQSSVTAALPFFRASYDSLRGIDAQTLRDRDAVAIYLEAASGLVRQLAAIGEGNEAISILRETEQRFGTTAPSHAGRAMHLAYAHLALAHIEALETKQVAAIEKSTNDFLTTPIHKEMKAGAEHLLAVLAPLDHANPWSDTPGRDFQEETFIVEAKLVAVRVLVKSQTFDRARVILNPILARLRPHASNLFGYNRIWTILYMDAELDGAALEFEILKTSAVIDDWKKQRETVTNALRPLRDIFARIEPYGKDALWFLRRDSTRRVMDFRIGILAEDNQAIIQSYRALLNPLREVLVRNPSAQAFHADAASMIAATQGDIGNYLKGNVQAIEACAIALDFIDDVVSPATEPIYRRSFGSAANCLFRSSAPRDDTGRLLPVAGHLITALARLTRRTGDDRMEAQQLESVWDIISAVLGHAWKPSSGDATAFADAWENAHFERIVSREPFQRFARYQRFLQQGSLAAGLLVEPYDPARSAKFLKTAASVGRALTALNALAEFGNKPMAAQIRPDEAKRLEAIARRLPNTQVVDCYHCLPYTSISVTTGTSTNEDPYIEESLSDYLFDDGRRRLIVDFDARGPDDVFKIDIPYWNWLRPSSKAEDDLSRQAKFCLNAAGRDISCAEAMTFALNLRDWIEEYLAPHQDAQAFINMATAATTAMRNAGQETAETCDAVKLGTALTAAEGPNPAAFAKRFHALDMAACAFFDLSYMQNHTLGLYRPAADQNDLSCQGWYGIAFGAKVAPEKKCAASNETQNVKATWKTSGFSHSGKPIKLPENLLDEKVVILLQGKNIPGDMIYTYLQLTLRSLESLRDVMRAQQDFMPSDYGKVLAAGKGEPSLEVRRFMAFTNNMIEVPRAEASLSMLPEVALLSLVDDIAVSYILPPPAAASPAIQEGISVPDSIVKKCVDLDPSDRHEAIQACSRGLETVGNSSPRAAYWLVLRAIHLLRDSQPERAGADARAALALSPRYGLAFDMLIQAYIEQKNLEGVDKTIGEAIQQQPQFTARYQARACYARAVLAKDLARALDYCNTMLKAAPKESGAHASRALLYLRMGRLREALSDYSAALDIAPDSPDALYGRGIVEQRLGDKIGAKKDIAAAVARDAGISGDFDRIGIHQI